MTGIEWTDKTWNPVTGCSKVSPGCDHCYAEKITERFHGKGSFAEVKLHPERLDAPLRWRKPARVFVNSMSDLFHDDVSDEFIARVWAVMALTPRHTYQVLTKRHGRMRSLLLNWRSNGFGDAVATEMFRIKTIGGIIQWPLPNVWLGVSVEDQKRADLRIPALLDAPAAVRFLSCEPLLSEVDLLPFLPGRHWPDTTRGGGGIGGQMVTVDPSPIGWVIVGGESGPGARPMELEWARSIVDDCAVCDVPVFVKQLGAVHGRGKGGDMAGWPADLRVREWPAPVTA